jgi:hypothetical protein
MMKTIAFVAWMGVPCVAAAEIVVACDIGSGPTTRVEVIREAPIADTHIYLLRQNGKVTPVFSDAEDSRGAAVRVACVGTKIHALVLSGEFAANAVQGFVLTYEPSVGESGRLDFAEKRRPKWLYLSKAQTKVLIPAGGLGETNKKYVAYRIATGSNDEPVAEGVDRLPEVQGYEMVDLGGPGNI